MGISEGAEQGARRIARSDVKLDGVSAALMGRLEGKAQIVRNLYCKRSSRETAAGADYVGGLLLSQAGPQVPGH